MDDAIISFKAPKETRDKFREAVKKHGLSMQSALFSMVDEFIERSNSIKIRIISKGDQNGK